LNFKAGKLCVYTIISVLLGKSNKHGTDIETKHKVTIGVRMCSRLKRKWENKLISEKCDNQATA